MQTDLAAGPDGITPKPLKNLKHSILLPLKKVPKHEKKSLQDRKVPADWNMAIVMPIKDRVQNTTQVIINLFLDKHSQ